MPDEWLITRADLSRAIRNLHQITIIPFGGAAVRGEAFDPSILAHDILREIDKAADGGEAPDEDEPDDGEDDRDPELRAMGNLVAWLQPLSHDGRKRVLAYICHRFDVEITPY